MKISVPTIVKGFLFLLAVFFVGTVSTPSTQAVSFIMTDPRGYTGNQKYTHGVSDVYFTANSDKEVYAPGETATISGTAQGGICRNGWHGIRSEIKHYFGSSEKTAYLVHPSSKELKGQTEDIVYYGSKSFSVEKIPGKYKAYVRGSTFTAPSQWYPIPYTVATDPTVSLTASPNPVNYNTPSTLTYTSANATSCTASATPTDPLWNGAITPNTANSTKQTSSLTQAGTYTLSCANASGTKQAQTTIAVLAQPLKPQVDLTANPTSITLGVGQSLPKRTTLTWTVTGGTPTSCTAKDGWSGSKNIAGGNQSVSVATNPTKFTITCQNASGSSEDDVSVTSGCFSNACSSGQCDANFTPTSTYSCTNACTSSADCKAPSSGLREVAP